MPISLTGSEHSAREMALLLRVVSAANRSFSVDELAETSLDAIRSVVPVDLAFFLLVDPYAARLRLSPRVNVPEELVRSLEDLPVPSEFFRQAEDPDYGAYALSNLADEIRPLLSTYAYPNPTTVPLLADHRGLGVLALAQRAEADDNLYLEHFAHKDFLDAISAEVGSAMQRARLAEQLRASEEKYRSIIEQSPDGFWESDPQGLVTVANKAVLEMMGYSREEVLGKVFSSLIVEDVEAGGERLARLQRDGCIVDERVKFRAKDGTVKTGNLTVRAVRDASGEIVKYQTICREVTARARMEQELTRRVAELEAIARVGELLAGRAEPEEPLREIANEICGVLHADSVSFQLREGDTLRVVWSSVAERTLQPILDYQQNILDGLEPRVVPDREAVDVDEEQRLVLKGLGFASSVGVRLFGQQASLGILFVNQRTPRNWTPDEVRLISTFARQVASARHTANLLRETQARVDELESVADMSMFAASLIGEGMLIDLAMQFICESLGVDVVGVNLLDGDHFRLGRVRGADPVPTEPLEMTPMLQDLINSRKLFVFDGKHPLPADSQAVDRVKTQSARALLTMPLVTASRVIGILSVGSRKEHVWTRAESRSVQTIANQLATGITNARLFAEQVERARRLALLAELSHACSGVHELSALLKTAVQHVHEMLGAAQVSIRLVQGESLTEGVGLGYAHPERLAHPIRIDERLRNILSSSQPAAISDLEVSTALPALYVSREREENARALLMVPLTAEGEPLGILSVFLPTPREWAPAEIQFAQTISNTVSAALANARLFESLQQERGDLEATLNSVFSGVFSTDETGIIQNWNRAAVEMTGFSTQVMRGKNWEEIARLGGNKPDRLIFEAMAGGEVVFGLAPRTLTAADGRVIPLGEAAAPLRDQAGKIRGAVGAFWDRTKETMAERAKLDFLHEVSHEMRNSLTAVLAMATMLRDKKLHGPTRERAIQVLSDQVDRLKAFSDRFLSFEEEQFKQPLPEKSVDVDKELARLIKAARLEHSEHPFRLTGKAGTAYGDRARLETVVTNLLDNAAKYSPHGSPISIEASPMSDERIRIAVRNEGPGIPRQEQGQIFERGYRTTASVVNRQSDGSGIGLWLVEIKLHEMGGEICMDSDEIHGVTFYFTLRRARGEDGQEQAADSDRGRRQSRGRRAQRRPRARRL
jgi:two-component system phosphate regulon sensor histidine kinase PhoR